MTAGDRTSWAEARETYFRAAPNRTSLEAIEKAAFVLALDDEEYEIGLVSVKILLNKKKNRKFEIDQYTSNEDFVVNRFCTCNL